MTYDQAQSPRLGQRTQVESTYVQIFDVDPDTPTADLVEAAYPGQIIFRKDRSILQIFDEQVGAWGDIAGGVAGALSYVGSTPPPTPPAKQGDSWYDSGNGYRLYAHNGMGWIEPAASVDTNSIKLYQRATHFLY